MGKRKLIRLVRLLQTGNRKFARSVQFFQAGNRKFLCLVQRLRGVGQALSRTEELIDRIPVWGSYFLVRFEGQKPWQHFRAMHDFGSLDAKRGPSRQDPYAMYPKPPDCTWKWTHRARILPFRSRKAYILGKHCQGEGLLRAFIEKRTHTVRFLPGDAVKQPQREGWMRASWGGCRREWLLRRGRLLRGRKKRPHVRPLSIKAIGSERSSGELERGLRLSCSLRESRSSSWGERIRGILQEPWCQQRCDRSYGIPKP